MKIDSNLKKISLLVGDIFVFYAALWLTLLLRYRSTPDSGLWWLHFWPFSYVFATWIIIFYISSLYDLRIAVNNARFWQTLSRTLGISFVLAVIFFYLTPQIIAPKTNLLLYVLVLAVLFPTWRQLYNWALASYLPKNTIGIIGWNEQVKELLEEIKSRSHLGYRISFIINDNESNRPDAEGVEILPQNVNLTELVGQRHINTLVFVNNPHESLELRNTLFACLPLKINFINLPLFYESLAGKVPITAISQTWFLENLDEGGKFGFDLFKRLYDLVLAAVLLAITSPLWLLIAIGIKLESRGPVFFIQKRLGRNGTVFNILKFRTMTVEGNSFAPTAANDKRVTRFGRFLRKSRLDELPQAINIIKGEMSFVGPRPERPELVKELEQRVPFYRERMLVNPGVTGWDQISGEYHSPSYEDTMKKLQYDLFYIKNRSIYLDLSIILKTIYTMASRAGQ
ncbi:sugar transferase [Candidatus Falkowbacteria bacterium]|nr:sugar transferase [Candidatus Falkowbacteria bacterium]